MSKELKVKYENFKSKLKVVPAEIILKKDRIKYNRAEKKEANRNILKDWEEIEQ